MPEGFGMENGRPVIYVGSQDVTLTLSKSDYNYILTTMGIEHGSEVVERIKAGVVK